MDVIIKWISKEDILKHRWIYGVSRGSQMLLENWRTTVFESRIKELCPGISVNAWSLKHQACKDLNRAKSIP
jgi:hypothetical protein